jgi:stage V sporulation protein SpoVS
VTQGHLHVSEDGRISAVGKPAVDVFAAIAIARGLDFYAQTGMKINRMYTPANMRRKAEEITGLKFKSRDYAGMSAALRKWANDQRGTTVKVTSDRKGE